MAYRAERNQVLLGIFPCVATKLLMMDFQVGHCAARLTAPAIAAKDLLPQILVGDEIKS